MAGSHHVYMIINAEKTTGVQLTKGKNVIPKECDRCISNILYKLLYAYDFSLVGLFF